VKNGLKHALPTYLIRQLMYNTFLSYMPVDIVSAVAQDPRMDCLPKKTMKLYIVDVHALLYEKRATHFGRREGAYRQASLWAWQGRRRHTWSR
jgi:hypothetical protein